METIPNLGRIDPEEWNGLYAGGTPFTRHGYLDALERTACVGGDSGWDAMHLGVYDGHRLVAALPCYIKAHSRGEYVFDWGWADAYHRHGLAYYPKLLTAVPFTPVTGKRIGIHPLFRTEAASSAILATLLDTLLSLLQRERPDHTAISSWHLLFPDEQESERWLKAASAKTASGPSLLLREAVQYHWCNRSWRDFDEFLAALSSGRRKNIRKERRRVAESGLEYCWREGPTLTDAAISSFYPLYASTYFKRGQYPYLNEAFFQSLREQMLQSLVLLEIRRKTDVVAGALFLRDDCTLYGRYWGCREEATFLHFEACYYRGIDYCIQHGIERFDAGAQGEHKLLRGFEPVITRSLHLIGQQDFRNAIEHFLQQERAEVNHWKHSATAYLPYRAADPE